MDRVGEEHAGNERSFFLIRFLEFDLVVAGVGILMVSKEKTKIII